MAETRSRYTLVLLLFLPVITHQYPRTGSAPPAPSSDQCHESPGQEALEHFASKRPYHSNGAEDDVYTPEGCTPVKLWYFGRHGTRYPGEEDIEGMIDVLPGLHSEILGRSSASTLCPSTLKYFSTWEPRRDLNVSTESYLTEQGRYELKSIASRYISRFPNLFPQEFSNSTYFFKFTNSQRTNASAHAFVSSIFGEPNLNSVWFPPALDKDPVLKFYSLCKKWEQEVDKNPAANIQHDLFLKSLEMNETIQRVSRRLGLERNLTLEEITLVYTTCAFESAWANGTLSPWCGIFSTEDLQVMEYREDLDYYWKDGYGFQVNYEQACSPFKDAVAFFDEYPGEQHDTKVEYRKTQGYFSHSGATIKMLARLGLFNGTEIKADNFKEVKDSYEWRTSRIDCMGTNMALVMYSCSNATEIEMKRQIGLFFQEKPTEFEACGGRAFCSYEEFRRNFVKFTDDCDLEKICRV